MLIEVKSGARMTLQDALTINLPAWVSGESTSLGVLSMEFRYGQAGGSHSFQFPVEGLLAKGLFLDAFTLWLNACAQRVGDANSRDWYLPQWSDTLDEFLDTHQRMVSPGGVCAPGWLVGNGVCHRDHSVYSIEMPILVRCQINDEAMERLAEGREPKRSPEQRSQMTKNNIGCVITPRIVAQEDVSIIRKVPDNFVGMSSSAIYSLISSVTHNTESSLRGANE